MFSKSLCRLILCVNFLAILPTINCSPDELSLNLMNKLVGSPGLKELKDNQVRIDNEKTSLVAVLGSEPDRWVVAEENFETVSTVVFTTLFCAFSKKVYYLIASGKILLENCDARIKGNTNLSDCVQKVQTHLKAFKDYVHKLLASIYYFAKKTQIAIDKNFMGTLLSVHFYLQKEGVYLEPRFFFVVNPLTNVRLVIDRLILTHTYIINQAEAYTIEWCQPWSFDPKELPLPIKAESENLEEKLSIDEIDTMGSSLAYHVAIEEHFLDRLDIVDPADHARIEEHYIDEFEMGDPSNNSDLFNLGTLMLNKLLDIELVSGQNDTALRCMTLQWPYMPSTLEHSYVYVLADYHSDLIIKHQVLAMETIGSIIFYLVLEIIGSNEETALEALEFLESLKFPGQIETVINQINLYAENQYTVDKTSELIKAYFSSATVNEVFLSQFITSVQPVDDLSVILSNFIESIKKIKPDIALLLESHEGLCDYEYENSGFMQSIAGEGCLQDIHKSFVRFNCTGATTMIKHLVFSNYLLDQCETLANDSYNSNSTKKGTNVTMNVCLSKILIYIKSIETNIMLFLDAIIDVYESNTDYHTYTVMPINRKLIESIYALVLFVNNQTTADVEGDDALVKIEELRRSQLFVINHVMQFTMDRCQVLSIEQLSEPVCNVHISGASSKIVDGIMNKVECIGESINDNLKDIPIAIDIFEEAVVDYCNNIILQAPVIESTTDESPDEQSIGFALLKTHKFNFELLLLEVIIEKSRLPCNGFSMLNDIRTTWKGKSKSLIEVRDIVRQEPNPKYLFRYQLLMMRMVVFIAYEHMRDIVFEIQNSNEILIEDTHFSLLEEKIDAILQSPYPDHITGYIYPVYELFLNFLNNTETSKNGVKIIKAITVGQSKLELYLKPTRESVISRVNISSAVIQTETLPQNTLIEPVVDEAISNVTVLEETPVKSLQRFMDYLDNVMEVRDDLNQVLHVVDWRKVLDVSMT